MTIKWTNKPYTLVGPTVTITVQDPLAVLHLYNQLYIFLDHFSYFITFLNKFSHTPIRPLLKERDI